jgi:hypothetical protein
MIPPRTIETAEQAHEFVHENSARRMLGGALLFALVLPPTSRLVRRSATLKPLLETGLFPGLFTGYGMAAALGAFGGLCEDMCCRLSYRETLYNREPVEVEKW